MKTKLFKLALPIGFGLVLTLISVLGILSISLSSCKTDQCTDSKYPYYCEAAKKCCGYEYTDGHGTCYQTLTGCRASGYACEHCWKE